MNETDEMKLMTAPDGEPGIWETVHPNFTVFHEDDETFSGLWTAYHRAFPDFYWEFEEVLARYGDCHDIKVGRDSPPTSSASAVYPGWTTPATPPTPSAIRRCFPSLPMESTRRQRGGIPFR